MKNYWIITITHKTASLHHISNFMPTLCDNNEQELATLLQNIKTTLQVPELMYLATCNRILFLLVTPKNIFEHKNQFVIQLFKLLQPRIPKACIAALLDNIAIYNGSNAIQHLYEVAASIDSLVVGETEVLGQIKTAYDFCHRHRLTADNIRLLMQTTIPVAKKIHQYTNISKNNVSVASLALQKILQHSPKKNAKIALIGAGETNTLMLKLLVKEGFQNFTIYNRTFENAVNLAQKVKGNPQPLTEILSLPQQKNTCFDIIITCIGNMETKFSVPLHNFLQNTPNNQKVILLDLAIPQNILPQTTQLPNVQYIEIEQLKNLSQINLQQRQAEVQQAQQLIAQYTLQFEKTHKRRQTEIQLLEIPQKMEEIKQHALNHVFEKDLQNFDENQRQIVQKLANYLQKKFVAIPMQVTHKVLENQLYPTENI